MLNIVFEKPFSNGSLLVFNDGQIFIHWKFTDKQKPFLGIKIPWFICFKYADLCEKHLKFPHATCVSCKLLRAVREDLPTFTPIIIRQIWDIQPKSKVQEILFRHSLSFAEIVSSFNFNKKVISENGDYW